MTTPAPPERSASAGSGRPASAWDELARTAGRRAAGPAEAELRRELLVLWLDGDPYALPVERVREIVRVRPITPVPRMPASVRGVVSLRGEILQVIDLRRRLELAPAEVDRSRRARIVVLNSDDGQLTGLLVDRVSEVLRVDEEALRPPAGRESYAVVALAPYGERFVSLFDVERLLDLGE